jgi:hypothetical protein
MDAPKHDAEKEAQELLQRMAMNCTTPLQQQNNKRIGG